MCGGGNQAAKDAALADERRQMRIGRNVRDIESAYAGREPQYADFITALRGSYGRDLGNQQAKAGRSLRFSLASRGLTKGSADRDESAQFQRESAEGALNAERAVQRAGADLRLQDEQTKQNLIGIAQSGNDVGNVAAQAASTLRANIQGASNANTAQGLGDLFTNTLDTYRRAQEARAYRRGLGSVYSSPLGGR